jgi:hypothetical protein
MSNFTFQKATKQQSKLRLAIDGPSGSGKTYTALSVGSHLGERMAVIDTERGSASLYSDIFSFDVLNLETFSPLTYAEAIRAAVTAGYDVIVIDSLSHAWMGKDGALEQVDKAAKRSSSGNSFTAWKDVTPMHNEMVDTILQAPVHIIVTMRTKTEYVIEKGDNGKSTPRKVGMAPIQRDGMEYEFTVVADMDLENNFIVSKSRCSTLSGAVIKKPGKDVADILLKWLNDGSPVPTCADCGHEIKSGTAGGNLYTSDQIVELTIRKSGDQRCLNCYATWNEQNKTSKAKKEQEAA